MKGKNKNNNDKKARKPVVNEDSLYTEALESSENKPTEDFMEAPIESSKKSVTLNELAEIDPELLTGRSGEIVKAKELPALPDNKNNNKLKEPDIPVIPTEINLDKNEDALEKEKFKRNAGIAFVILGIILVTVIAAATFVERRC